MYLGIFWQKLRMLKHSYQCSDQLWIIWPDPGVDCLERHEQILPENKIYKYFLTADGLNNKMIFGVSKNFQCTTGCQ